MPKMKDFFGTIGKQKNYDSRFWESALVNNRTFNAWYNRLKEIAITCFTWENLPDTIDKRFLEMCLFERGMCLFFKDEDMNPSEGGEYLALNTTIGGQLNVYNIPVERRAYATNGYNKNMTEKDSVLIWNNYIHCNSVDDILMFAWRLTNIDRTIDVNVNAQKTPVLIKTTENQRMVVQNVYMKYEGNQPVIIGDKNLDDNGIMVLKTDAPYVSDKLTDLKVQIWNEALTYLGIPNVAFNKKERMIKDEVQRTQGGVVASRFSRLKAREEACEQINKMFDLDISVRYNDELDRSFEDVSRETFTEADEGGDFYE